MIMLVVSVSNGFIFQVHIGGHTIEFTPSSSSSVSKSLKNINNLWMESPLQVGVTFNGRPMSVEDQGAAVGKEGRTKLFTLV